MNCLVEQNEPSSLLLNKELRHVGASQLNKLSAILDQDMGWKVLLQELTRPKAPDGTGTPNSSIWNLDAINLIEQQIYCGKSPTWELLNYWAITGRRRPTIKSLITHLRSCNLKRAEDYTIQSILGIEQLKNSQSMKISISEAQKRPLDEYNIADEFIFDNLDEILKDVGNDCLKYSFKLIYETTNGFCHKPYNLRDKSGTKIGEGRFSSVFRAKTCQPEGPQEIVAAKLLKSDCNINYIINEIKLMMKVKHENILELLGVAMDRSAEDRPLSYICLIYQYMENGSLLDCLSSGLPTKDTTFLTWTNRINIAVKVARGILYLHSFQGDPIVHRDIKTANILLDDNLDPKIGDFTLVRQIETQPVGETHYSQNVIGTSVYMSPEAFRGDISKKTDVFSYGIVLFELLTGLRPFDDESNEDLLTFIIGKLSDIEEEFSEEPSVSVSYRRDSLLRELLDKKAGSWEFSIARNLFDLAIQSSETIKKKRPEIESILPDLENILAKCPS